jgi:predicted RNase H-like HicB family nuclease
MKYRVLIEQDEDGVFVAEVPSLPGCISQGQSREEAIKNIKEAIALYIESLEAHDEAVPPTITRSRKGHCGPSSGRSASRLMSSRLCYRAAV